MRAEGNVAEVAESRSTAMSSLTERMYAVLVLLNDGASER
jgi:hypothetical protein